MNGKGYREKFSSGLKLIRRPLCKTKAWAMLNQRPLACMSCREGEKVIVKHNKGLLVAFRLGQLKME